MSVQDQINNDIKEMLLSQDNFNRTEVFIMKAISRTVVPIKPGKKSDAEAFMSQKSREISSVKGLINWGFMYTDENEITVIAVYTNKDSAQNATKYVNELNFDGHIILTDLCAPKPVASNCQRMWMTTKANAERPYFQTNERVIAIDA